MDTVDKKTKILFTTLGLLISISFYYSFNKFFIQEDFFVYAQTSCNPEQENCFIQTCDEPDCENKYYKITMRKSSTIPSCNPYSGSCNELSCSDIGTSKSTCYQFDCDSKKYTELLSIKDECTR